MGAITMIWQSRKAKAISEDACFAEFSPQCGIFFDYLKRLITDELIPWEEHFGFLAKEVPSHWIETDNTLAAINKVHPIDRIGILRVPANTCYDWHVDSHRLCCVNMLLSGGSNSLTLFGGERAGRQTRQIIPIEYKPRTFYLFNNQIEHTVINLGPERFLFSLYFKTERMFDVVYAKLDAAGLLAD